MAESTIFHIDVNSAFLSWEAAYRVNTLGDQTDLRDIASAVGGDQKQRHGIILAKSIPAKQYNIQTGEPIASALKKCPNLTIVPPRFDIYVKSSREFMSILYKYSPKVEQYSIDEAFCDMTGTEQLYGSPISFATKLKDEIFHSLGFSVNIGISTNKLLAKMASDFKKPNLVHTLFPEEIPTKMWPLPVGDLFFVGKSTEKKLLTLGIKTIGDLAHTDPSILSSHLKKHGEFIWNYANGIDPSPVSDTSSDSKGYGNSTTLSHDITDNNIANTILLSLCETVCTRLRMDKTKATCISVSITDYNFITTSHQSTLFSSTNSTDEIFFVVSQLFSKLWDFHTPIRGLGVQTSKVTKNEYTQYNLFDADKFERLSKLDKAVDNIREKYGDNSIMRACFLDSSTPNLIGGTKKNKKTGIDSGLHLDKEKE